MTLNARTRSRVRPGLAAAVVLLGLTLSAAVPVDIRAASTKALLRDCSDGVIRHAYTETAVRRALRVKPPAACADALRFELGAISATDEIVGDCYDDGRIDGPYTRRELLDAERDLPADVDEYSDCRSVIRRAMRRATDERKLARLSRRARVPLTIAKAGRYGQRLGDRSARARTRLKYARRVGVRAIRLQAHYERSAGDGITRCFAEILVQRSGATGRVAARVRQEACDPSASAARPRG